MFVYKLIARNTVEEKVQKLQQFKQGLADQLFAGGKGQVWQGGAQDLLALFGESSQEEPDAKAGSKRSVSVQEEE